MTNPIIAIDADTAAEAVALLSSARRVQLILSAVTTVAQLEQADALLAAIVVAAKPLRMRVRALKAEADAAERQAVRDRARVAANNARILAERAGEGKESSHGFA